MKVKQQPIEYHLENLKPLCVNELIRAILGNGDESPSLARQLNQAIILMLATLTPREKAVCIEYFGLVTGSQLKVKEIGKLQGLTPSRIYQIMRKLLRKLRHPSRLHFLFPPLNVGT